MNLAQSDIGQQTLYRSSIDILQVNVGMRCNQACVHCHHKAGPNRTELMSAESCRKVLCFLEESKINILELTGGAPELNPNFRMLVERARKLEKRVITRSNLTVLFEDGTEGLPQFMANHDVELVCSLPCYTEENVDSQRGTNVFRKSIQALEMLNNLGYGQENSGLILNLVYNPGGAFLPGNEQALEDAYRENLWEAHRILFNKLFTITNMPIGRFADRLRESGDYTQYIRSLINSAKMSLLDNAMCRRIISVGWDGCVYDCDFNQALGLTIGRQDRKLWDWSIEELPEIPITLREHCYGCIAGTGSSCTGSLVGACS